MDGVCTCKIVVEIAFVKRAHATVLVSCRHAGSLDAADR